ncbi:hypothetical protein BC940DRAFT_299774 [Gongronella butleri]|nr:hypothetical protein BC940DRAFT_299774 [Gongronella butleri]
MYFGSMVNPGQYYLNLDPDHPRGHLLRKSPSDPPATDTNGEIIMVDDLTLKREFADDYFKTYLNTLGARGIAPRADLEGPARFSNEQIANRLWQRAPTYTVEPHTI